MPRTNLVNAVDVELAAPVAAPDLTIEVDDASLLPAVPFYLVVDPFNDTQGREYMLCTLVTATTLTVTRMLAGSDSDVHDTGDIVRITVAAQHFEDVWDSIESIPPPGLGLPAGGVIGDSLRKTSAIDGESVFKANVEIATVQPPAPLLGDFWMNPDETGPPGGYLPLSGGTMTGHIDMQSNRIVGLTWQLWDVWKLRASAQAGFLINTSAADGDERILQLTPTIVNFIKTDDATSALQYVRIGDYWQFGSQIRIDGNDLVGLNNMQALAGSPLVFKDDAGTNRIIVWEAGIDATVFYSENADEVFRVTNAGTSMAKELFMGGNNVSNLLNLIGQSTTSLNLRPGATQRLIIRDDATSRFIVEPTSIGNLNFYDTSTQLTLAWNQSLTRWQLSQILLSVVDVPLTNKAMRNINAQVAEPTAPFIGDIWLDIS